MPQSTRNRLATDPTQEPTKLSACTARATWNRPELKKLASENALTGVNSTTDATNTFS